MLNPTQFQAKEEKVQVADDSLSEANPLSEWHLLSGLGNPRRGSVRDVLAQCTASPPSKVVVFSRT